MGDEVVYTRRNVHGLAGWDDTLLWYSRAVEALQAKPISDPTGWRFQGAVHGYDASLDPFAQPGEAMPSSTDRARFWDRCQHSSWFFLSWHRAYLTYFERIVRKTIVDLEGPSDWALPYWNYSDASNPDARFLPQAFVDPLRPDGTLNPLSITRDIDGQGGASGLASWEVDLACLIYANFTGVWNGANPGFGGPKTVFNHGGGSAGFLEVVPHGSVHVAVGHWMAAFETAALDPIFWLHHCNIDRLWEVWRARSPAHANPTDPDWLDAVGAVFELHDENGTIVNVPTRDFIDTINPPMEYEYDDTSDPVSLLAAAGATGPVMPAPAPSVLVGASSVNLDLNPAGLEAEVPGIMSAAASVSDADLAARRIYLAIENLTADFDGGSFAVLFGIKGESDASFRRADAIVVFGARTTPTADGSARSGVTQTLDVTPDLGQEDFIRDIRADRIEVRMRPLRPTRDDANIKVGRISFYAE